MQQLIAEKVLRKLLVQFDLEASNNKDIQEFREKKAEINPVKQKQPRLKLTRCCSQRFNEVQKIDNSNSVGTKTSSCRDLKENQNVLLLNLKTDLSTMVNRSDVEP